MNKVMKTPTNQTLQPVDLFGRLRTQMDDLFANFFNEMPAARMPAMFGGADFAVDVAETEAGITVKAELPGVDPADVTVTLDGPALVIAAEKKTETEDDDKEWHRVERTWGALKRVVPLGFEPDQEKVTAKLEKGVLTVGAPRPEVERPKARKVEVKST